MQKCGYNEHRRTGQHPFGGQTEFCTNGFAGGGGVAEIFRDPHIQWGGGSSRDFPRPRFGRGGGGSGRIISVSCSDRP